MDATFCQRLGVNYPIIQAPMAGGGDTPALVAAVCDAGALGTIGAAYLTPGQIFDAAAAVRRATTRPFGINLFAPLDPPAPADTRAAIELVAPFYAELQLAPPASLADNDQRFDAQLAAVLECGASVFSFTFGMIPPGALAALKGRLMVCGTATSVAEAVALEQAGVDAVIAQGAEAGGHRGTFLGSFDDNMIGTFALLPQVVDAVSLPVIASGGIMDGRGVAAALLLGASAVQMGTAFLACHEAGVPESYKSRLTDARETDTRVTRAFSGRPARGIANRFMTTVDAGAATGAILPFPLQNALTRPLRKAAAAHDRADYLSLWAGQGVTLARRQAAATLVAQCVADAREALGRTATIAAASFS